METVLLWQRIANTFGDQIYDGQIVSLIRDVSCQQLDNYFKMNYEDGNKEDLHVEELHGK